MDLERAVAASNQDLCEEWIGGPFAIDWPVIDVWSADALPNTLADGLLFPNITIPRGSTMIYAYIEIYRDGDVLIPDDMMCDVYGNNVDSANNFTVENAVVARARTTATVYWLAPNTGLGWLSSPGLAPIVQEWIDRPGYASDNDLAMLLIPRVSVGGEEWGGYSWDGHANKPHIHLSWTPPQITAKCGGMYRSMFVAAPGASTS